MSTYIHATALVEDDARIGQGTKIWHYCHIRHNAQIGKLCVLGRGVFVDADVMVGDNVKIQNYVSVYTGVSIADGVFIGPHVCFTNDLFPRAVNPDMSPKGADDWIVTETHIERGASIGANTTIVCGVTIGEWAMVGAGSVVTKNIAPYTLIVGSPAKPIGFVCACGNRKNTLQEAKNCPGCNANYEKRDLV
jgi:acetyltransferase-like isoleucine patch superfamily enzyme